MSSRLTLLAAVAALAGCTRSADLPASLVANDSEAVFDTVDGAPSSRRVFGFTNVGEETTPPLSVELRGDVDRYQIETDGCSGATLKQDGHCEIGVLLVGAVEGAADGELRVFAAEPLAASVLLHGKVTPTALVLAPVADSSVAVDQGNSATLDFTVGNRGGAASGPLHVTGDALPFDRVAGDCEGTMLAGGASCTITLSRNVGFDAALGAAAGTLRVTATPGGELTATATLFVNAGGVLIADSADWGTLPTLKTMQASLRVTNPGSRPSGPITIAVVSVDSYTPFKLVDSDCAGKSLAAGETCAATVSVTLYEADVYNANLKVSAPNVPSINGALQALGMRAHWALNVKIAGNGSGTIAFGTLPLMIFPGGTTLSTPNGQALASPFTATADAGSTFTGWSGSAPCSGTGACGPFTGADNADLTLQANFTK